MKGNKEMGEAKSPRITRQDVKAHFRYVWKQRGSKGKRKWALTKGKVIDRAQVTARSLAAKLPFTIVWKNKIIPDTAWLSAQDLFLPPVIGTPGYNPIANPNPIRAQDRGDAPLPVYDTYGSRKPKPKR